MVDWCLLAPEGAVSEEAFVFGRRFHSLSGKTVLFRWNGKHNGDVFLNRVADLLCKTVKGVIVVKDWESVPGTSETSSSPQLSREFAEKVAAQKPDLVIASTGD